MEATNTAQQGKAPAPSIAPAPAPAPAPALSGTNGVNVQASGVPEIRPDFFNQVAAAGNLGTNGATGQVGVTPATPTPGPATPTGPVVSDNPITKVFQGIYANAQDVALGKRSLSEGNPATQLKESISRALSMGISGEDIKKSLEVAIPRDGSKLSEGYHKIADEQLKERGRVRPITAAQGQTRLIEGGGADGTWTPPSTAVDPVLGNTRMSNIGARKIAAALLASTSLDAAAVEPAVTLSPAPAAIEQKISLADQFRRLPVSFDISDPLADNGALLTAATKEALAQGYSKAEIVAAANEAYPASDKANIEHRKAISLGLQSAASPAGTATVTSAIPVEAPAPSVLHFDRAVRLMTKNGEPNIEVKNGVENFRIQKGMKVELVPVNTDLSADIDAGFINAVDAEKIMRFQAMPVPTGSRATSQGGTTLHVRTERVKTPGEEAEDLANARKAAAGAEAAEIKTGVALSKSEVIKLKLEQEQAALQTHGQDAADTKVRRETAKNEAGIAQAERKENHAKVNQPVDDQKANEKIAESKRNQRKDEIAKASDTAKEVEKTAESVEDIADSAKDTVETVKDIVDIFVNKKKKK